MTLIKLLCDTLSISPEIAKGFLLKNHWNSDKVISAFLEDPERLYKKSFNIDLSEASKLLKVLKEKGKLEYCPACYEEEVSDYVSMECGHALCRLCYTFHVKTSFSEGPGVVLCICPVAPCELIVSN